MGRIPEEDVQRVRDATDIVTLVQESVVLKRKGRLYWGLCPFHAEKTPSFKVDPTTQLWHCFGCSEGGDVFGFLMRQEHMEFPDAVRLLAERAHIEIREEGGGVPSGRRERLRAASEAAADFYHKTLVGSKEPGPSRAREYLSSRGFGIEVAKRFTIGYAPGRNSLVGALRQAGYAEDEIVEANLAVRGDRGLRDRFYERVMFPIRDVQGRTVGFGGRILEGDGPKYLNTQETPVFHKSRNLYAIERAKNAIVAAGEAVVVEGYTDVIALHEAGITNVVATLGTALTREHVKLLSRFSEKVVYLFDSDEAGMRAADRSGEFIDAMTAVGPLGENASIDLSVAVVLEGKDPADLVAGAGADAARAVVAGAVPLLQFLLDRRIEQQDLRTPEGRARALAAAARVLVSVKNSVLIHDYANYVADRLLVDYPTVQSALSKARPEFSGRMAEEGAAAGVHQSSREPRERRREPSHLAECEYVRLVAAVPSLRTEALEHVDDGTIADEGLRQVLRAVVKAGDAMGTTLYDRVRDIDANAASILSGLLVEDAEVDNPHDVASQLLSKLKEFDLERQIIERKARLRALDAVKDKTAYDDLFREIAELQVRMDKARRGMMTAGGQDEGRA